MLPFRGRELGEVHAYLGRDYKSTVTWFQIANMELRRLFVCGIFIKYISLLCFKTPKFAGI